MVFNMLNTVGQHQRKRNRAFRLAASKRASRRGVYLAKKPPLGYIRAEDGPNYLPDPERDGREDPSHAAKLDRERREVRPS